MRFSTTDIAELALTLIGAAISLWLVSFVIEGMRHSLNTTPLLMLSAVGWCSVNALMYRAACKMLRRDPDKVTPMTVFGVSATIATSILLTFPWY